MIEKDREPPKSILTCVYKGGTVMRCGVKLDADEIIDRIQAIKDAGGGDAILPTTNINEEVASDKTVISVNKYLLFYNIETPMPPKVKSDLVIANRIPGQ